jgi:hypothetical protein
LELSFQELLQSVLGSGVLLSLIGYLFREPISKYFTAKLEHKFNTELESLRAVIQAEETELSHIRVYLSSRKGEREAAFNVKLLEAVEVAYRNYGLISQFSFCVEILKSLDFEKIDARADEIDVQKFFKILVETMKVDEKLAELAKMDRSLPEIYLDDRTLLFFNAYKAVVVHAVTILKLYSVSIPKRGALMTDYVRKQVEAAVPSSKEGFEKYGLTHSYYWIGFLGEQFLQSLRRVASGQDRDATDAIVARNIAVVSEKMQGEARKMLQGAGIPPEFIKSPDVTGQRS